MGRALGLLSYVAGIAASGGMRMPYRSVTAGRAGNGAAWKSPGRRKGPGKGRKHLKYSNYNKKK